MGYKVLHQSIERQNKEKNEDALLFFEMGFFNEEKIKVMIVADGIGSLARSDEAAQRAVFSVGARIFKELQYRYLKEKNSFSRDVEYNYRQLEDVLRRAFCEANRRVCELDIGTEVGATLSVVLIFGEYAVAANIGDSPIYYYDGAELQLISKLHVKRKQNILTKSLGERRTFDSGQVYVHTIGCLKEGDFFIIGSDGAFGELTKKEILEVIQTSTTVERLERLFDAAGHHDDQSAIYYEVTDEDNTDDAKT